MIIQKELPSISWQVDEPTYRADPALSYSTLSRYEREGFNNLDKLFEHISTPSLTQGSMVDVLITGSVDDFINEFYVANMPALGEKETQVADSLFSKFSSQYISFSIIPDDLVLSSANEFAFQKNWRDDTRVRVLRERCANYYNIKYEAGSRTIVPLDLYNRVMAMVNALHESPATHGYFAQDDEFSPIRRYYQLKFKARLKGVDYRCMADLLVVDYDAKEIIPIDLKTSGHAEWDFQDSFCQWNYMIQARLYWLIIRANLDADPFFKDFTLKNYRFIVVNAYSLTPLVWEFPLTQAKGTLVDGKGNEYRDPLTIGSELRGYLDLKPKVPNGIAIDGLNTITCLKKLND